MLIHEFPDDPIAVRVTRETFGAVADGKADDTAAIQRAIDAVADRTGKGIVFVPAGTYLLSGTLYVWAGIRLVGVGPSRPVFKLADHTPGFAQDASRYMVHFADRKPEAGQPIRDGHPGTFYPAISHIDFEIGDGNPAAVGVRFHVAQHSFVAHVDFRTGSGRAGVEGVGNEFENCRFIGGEYGITTGSTAPSWPFLLMDSHFEGQRSAAIETDRAGMTIVRNAFFNVPSAVVIRAGLPEVLWMSDCTLTNVAREAVLISNATARRTQVNLQNLVCHNVPTFIRFRETDEVIPAPAETYDVQDFCHGLQIEGFNDPGSIRTTHKFSPRTRAPTSVPSDIVPLPPSTSWLNVRMLGATGDGATDDTAALRAAIASRRVLYFPTGRYRVSGTIELRSDTVLIGLHPLTAQIVLADNTPAFSGEGGPVPLLLAPKGGTCVVSGLGLDTGYNTRAVGCKWMAGERSMMNDVRFLGGHGTFNADGSRFPMYNNNRTADADASRKWDSQYHSLWITEGGGGTFKDIWTPSPYTQSGLYVSDTSTSGRVYALSAEHHVRCEVKLRNVSNWQFFGLQTEEEAGEGPHALAVEIDRCHDLLFANLILYRVEMQQPYVCAVQVQNCRDIQIRGSRIYSPGRTALDALVLDASTGAEVRERELARWTLSVAPPAAKAAKPKLTESEVVEVRRGFANADGAAVDAHGRVYFVDIPRQRIYRYDPVTEATTLVRDTPINPVALAFDGAGHLLIVTQSGNVVASSPDEADELLVLPTVACADHVNAPRLYPTGIWFGIDNMPQQTREQARLAPDGKTLVATMRGIGRTPGLSLARTGEPFYAADDGNARTWVFDVLPSGELSPGRIFAPEGGAGSAVDEAGNVYLAVGHVQVYDASGAFIERIEIPHRPSSLAFGGPDGRTLFITARTSLYAVRTRHAGRDTRNLA